MLPRFSVPTPRVLRAAGLCLLPALAVTSTLSRECLEPVGLGDLMDHSDLIVVLRPVQITLSGGGKAIGGTAHMKVVKVLKGESGPQELNVEWSAGEYETPIDTLDDRLLFE